MAGKRNNALAANQSTTARTLTCCYTDGIERVNPVQAPAHDKIDLVNGDTYSPQVV